MENHNYCYTNPNHYANLNDMRLTGKFCDVNIKVEDREIGAHKVILAANLKYFETMFLNSFRECKQDVITMENVNGSDLEALITYAYTGEIVLTHSNALGLLEVANYLSEDVVKKACIDYLTEHLQLEDACRAYKLANAIDCTSLKHRAEQIILSNFRNCRQITGYLDLDSTSLIDILACVCLDFDDSEQILFESIVTWIAHDAENRRSYVDQLLSFIVMSKLPSDWLLKYLCMNIDNEDYTGVIMDVMRFYNEATQEMKQRSRRSREYLIVTGRTENQNQNCSIQSYDFVEKKWSEPRELTVSNSGIDDLQAVVLKNKLYSVIYAKMKHESHLRVFDPMTKQSTVLNFDSRLLCTAAVCACTRYLYFCGGWIRNDYTKASDQVLKYDPLTNSFETLPSMGTKRANAAAIFYQGCLHVLGGYDGSHFLSSVEKYNPETKRWAAVPSMCEQRYVHAVAVLSGKLYACGGESKKSVEVYDPSMDRWQLVANMKENRHDFLVVAHEGKLLAIKGRYEKTIEVYDPSTNQWQTDYQLASALEMKFPSGGMISSTYIVDAD